MIKSPDGNVFILCRDKNVHLSNFVCELDWLCSFLKKYSTIFVSIRYVQELVVLEKSERSK